MATKIEVPHHSYDQIRKFANEFLSKFNSAGTIPVPIEEIAEFELGLNIIPIPGLQSSLEIEGFISSDLSSISVDQYVMEKVPTRYRFSLAHEIGHVVLHKDLFAHFDFNTVEDWKKFQTELSGEDHSWLEYQAYAFGGLVLVPREPLASRLTIFAEKVKQAGLDPDSEAAQFQISKALAAEFGVSTNVIEKRLQKDR